MKSTERRENGRKRIWRRKQDSMTHTELGWASAWILFAFYSIRHVRISRRRETYSNLHFQKTFLATIWWWQWEKSGKMRQYPWKWREVGNTEIFGSIILLMRLVRSREREKLGTVPSYFVFFWLDGAAIFWKKSCWGEIFKERGGKNESVVGIY